MNIIPAILTNDPQELDQFLRQIKNVSRFERVQVDFIDGEFADNKTFKPMEVDIVPYLPLKFDAHLMVTENNIIEWSTMAEKFGFDRIIAQMESISHPEDFSALALDIHSPVAALKPYLPKLDYVVVMSVEPGFGGQEFVEKALEHVREIKKYGVKICVDGGVDQEHLPVLEKMGVDEVAVGVKRVLSWK